MSSSKHFTCILCPKGCGINVIFEDKTILEIQEAGCKKGAAWAEQELLNPKRTLCTSIRVIGGTEPLVSVKTDREIPLKDIPKVMEVIKQTTVEAPIVFGTIAVMNPCNAAYSLLTTKDCAKE